MTVKTTTAESDKKITEVENSPRTIFVHTLALDKVGLQKHLNDVTETGHEIISVQTDSVILAHAGEVVTWVLIIGTPGQK